MTHDVTMPDMTQAMMTPTPMTDAERLASVRDVWAASWEDALAVWSRYTKLGEPRWCFTADDEAAEGLTGSFAMIRLTDQTVVISLRQIVALNLEEFSREILAHEIGHHVYCPADLTDHGRVIARIRYALPTKEALAAMVANLYTDLLINDRLHRGANLRIADVYRRLAPGTNALWTFYMRIYETLWGLPRQTLAAGEITPTLEADATLGARVVRHYARDWLRGAGRFAALCLPYLMADDANEALGTARTLLDTADAGRGGAPAGLAEAETDETEEAIHPSLDPDLSGVGDDDDDERARDDKQMNAPTGVETEGGRKSRTRYREPSEYNEILRALGVRLSEQEAAMRYYRELAIPHLIRFPTREVIEAQEPIAEGLEPWDAGSPLDEIDWYESMAASPRVIPGVTTVRRTYGTSAGSLPRSEPMDLYLGIDCSGSMANPQHRLSYPVLAGTIIAVSALRAGARVMAVLSGEPGSTVATDGFVRDERLVLELLTGYLGTGYAFGIHRLAEAFPAAAPARHARPRSTHILVITDHDIFSMLDGTPDASTANKSKHNRASVAAGVTGWQVARAALARAGGGGTFVLNMPASWGADKTNLLRAEGWRVANVATWEDIVDFARRFSRETYTADSKQPVTRLAPTRDDGVEPPGERRGDA